jgi:hypothetical protein
VGDPRFLWEMLYSSTDYKLRHFHYKEPNGTRVRAINHPNMVWYNGAHDWRMGSDLLGKTGGNWPTEGWDFFLRDVRDGRGGPDRQHRGQNYMWATGALTGSYLIQEDARDLIECEETRFPRRYLESDAPRACRIFQDFAKMYCILPEVESRDKLVTQMERYLQAWEQSWAGGTVSGPVKPMAMGGPDSRVLEPPRQFFVPWNEGVGLLGMLEGRALMRKIGRPDLQTRFENFIRSVVGTHLRYGIVMDNQGLPLPINGVYWLPDGQPQPASYYNIYAPGGGYRYGVSTTNGEPPGTNLLLGDVGWLSWWSGIIACGLIMFPPTSFEYQRATEIKNSRILPFSSLDGSEWYAVGQ